MKYMVEVIQQRFVATQTTYLVEATSAEEAKAEYESLGECQGELTVRDEPRDEWVESVTPMKLSVGSLVKAKSESKPLRCGFGVYYQAIVVSLEPFVLVSPETDMRWGAMSPEDVEVIGQATDVQLGKCMRRL